MASKPSDVSLFLDFEDKGGSATGLQFQDFPQGNFVNDAPPAYEKTHNFTNFPDSHTDDDDKISGTQVESSTGPSAWTFAYYQRFFDIDTSEVKERLMWSVVPRPSQDFLQHVIKTKPDLYGPFWVCATLIFCIAIMGNISDYIQSAGEGSQWRYDFRKVSISATTIFCYALLLPLLLWVFVWWRRKLGEQIALGFAEIVCLYGYSLAIYIPVSVLWTLPFAWLQWTLVIVAATLSGSVLLLALWKPLSSSQKSVAAILMIAILVAHILLAAGLQLYFFRYSSQGPAHENAVDSNAAEPLKLPDDAKLGAPAAVNDTDVKPVKSDSKAKREDEIPMKAVSSTLSINAAGGKGKGNGNSTSVVRNR